MANEAKLQDVKRKVDSMIGLPGMQLRKGAARSGNPLTGYVDYNYKLFRGGDQYDLQSTVARRTDPANNGKVEGGL